MPTKKFYLGCPNCVEPQTTLKYGNHVELNVTNTNFGAKTLVSINCTICGAIVDITEKVNQVSFHHFNELLKAGG